MVDATSHIWYLSNSDLIHFFDHHLPQKNPGIYASYQLQHLSAKRLFCLSWYDIGSVSLPSLLPKPPFNTVSLLHSLDWCTIGPLQRDCSLNHLEDICASIPGWLLVTSGKCIIKILVKKYLNYIEHILSTVEARKPRMELMGKIDFHLLKILPCIRTKTPPQLPQLPHTTHPNTEPFKVVHLWDNFPTHKLKAFHHYVILPDMPRIILMGGLQHTLHFIPPIWYHFINWPPSIPLFYHYHWSYTVVNNHIINPHKS